MLSRIFIFAALLITCGLSTVHAAAKDVLTVVWVENGDLMRWQSGDSAPAKIASGTIRSAALAPDAAHAAYTCGTDTASNSLWVVDISGKSEKQLVTLDALKGNFIGDVGWLDASTLYFNTVQINGVGQVRQDDLWRADLASGTATPILAPGKGGSFTFSPDGQWIALVRPGQYGGQQGQINLVDPLGQNEKDLLAFPAVSTGADYLFYPPVFWSADSQSLNVAIPDKDLIYADSTAMTALWKLGVDGSQKQFGTVQASFFALPQWSSDGTLIAYMQRSGGVSSNDFSLMVARGSGLNGVVYTSGTAGMLQFVSWLPGANQFLYAQGDPGTYWLGTPGQPQQLPGVIFTPRFVSPTTYIYSISSANNVFELRAADLQNPSASILIAQTSAAVTTFDAVLAP